MQTARSDHDGQWASASRPLTSLTDMTTSPSKHLGKANSTVRCMAGQPLCMQAKLTAQLVGELFDAAGEEVVGAAVEIELFQRVPPVGVIPGTDQDDVWLEAYGCRLDDLVKRKTSCSVPRANCIATSSRSQNNLGMNAGLGLGAGTLSIHSGTNVLPILLVILIRHNMEQGCAC